MGSQWCLVDHYLPVDRRETGIGKVVVYLYSYIDVYVPVCMCICMWERGEEKRIHIFIEVFKNVPYTKKK